MVEDDLARVGRQELLETVRQLRLELRAAVEEAWVYRVALDVMEKSDVEKCSAESFIARAREIGRNA